MKNDSERGKNFKNTNNYKHIHDNDNGLKESLLVVFMFVQNQLYTK